jgi:hypothetical protein
VAYPLLASVATMCSSGGHSGQTLPNVASIGIGPCRENPGTKPTVCGRGGGGGWWSAAVVHRISFQPTCAVTCLSNVGSSLSPQSSWRMLNLSVSPSIRKSSQRRHRVRVVTRAAHHAAKLVADLF